MDPATGDSQWVFESSEPGTKNINPTDSRFFWLANYVQPLLWVALAILALVRFMFIWLPLVGECKRNISPPPFGFPGRGMGTAGTMLCRGICGVVTIFADPFLCP